MTKTKRDFNETLDDYEEYIFRYSHLSRDEARSFARQAWIASLNKYEALKLTKNEEVAKEALRLSEHLNTEWAEEHSDQYDKFAEKIEKMYEKGQLNAKEFNTLACIAFYDYADLKEEEEYTGEHYVGEIVYHKGGDMIHECQVTRVWSYEGRNGISIIPTGNYGFEIDIYDEQL